MTRCRICKSPIQNGWSFCPKCGEEVKTGSVFPVSKMNYLWEKEDGGGLIYKNFRAVRESGLTNIENNEQIRPNLGDFCHINFYNLRKFSLLLYNPKVAYELYEAYKLGGYYDAENFIRGSKRQNIVERLSRTNRFWNIFKDKKFLETAKNSYSKVGSGYVEDIDVHEKIGKITFHLRETFSTPIKSPHSCCFENVADFAGTLESYSYRFWSGIESKCQSKGDEHCQFEMFITKTAEKPKIDILDVVDITNILDNIIRDLDKKVIYRRQLGDYIHISGEQSMNYILTSKSVGHEILSKHSGSIIGQKIVHNSELKTEEDALEYLAKIFYDLKVGLISPEYKNGTIMVKMQESVYSSGVNNINTKLDTFITGIIEGALRQATNQGWIVEEIKCIANGDPYCEFRCHTQR